MNGDAVRMAKRPTKTKPNERAGVDAEQARLHAAAEKCFGTISGGDPHASEKVRETVRKRLLERQRLGRV